MHINFCSLSSGSSGNCYYIGNDEKGILIDAGISATSIRRFLKEYGISLHSIMGILITHNHVDHIRGLQGLTKKYSIPAFTTSGVWNSIPASRSDISADCIREIQCGKVFSVAGFDIETFEVSHDAPETIGFYICYEDKKITVATDLGYISSNVKSYIEKANLLVLESNYDEQMLSEGAYPYYLKRRISSDLGHLSNKQTSECLADIMNSTISHIFLAHLSKNNNTPEKVIQTLSATFSGRGITIGNDQKITVLNRNIPTELFKIRCPDQSDE